MGDVIAFDAYRERRDTAVAAVHRLDRAVATLDPLVRSRRHRLEPTIERELREIGRAVSSGDARRAAERAERLVDLLQHPAASG